jgi:hypothetical protein
LLSWRWGPVAREKIGLFEGFPSGTSALFQSTFDRRQEQTASNGLAKKSLAPSFIALISREMTID